MYQMAAITGLCEFFSESPDINDNSLLINIRWFLVGGTLQMYYIRLPP